MSQIYPLPYTGAYIERVGIVWVDGKGTKYQNIPFWENMNTTDFYKTQEQKNAVISHLNVYSKIFCKAYILGNIKLFCT